jgi:hypothetical protein
MKIAEFISNDNLEYRCKSCNDVKLLRIFSNFSSKIELRKEDIIANAKREARSIVKKIKSGDTRSIRNIYGEK